VAEPFALAIAIDALRHSRNMRTAMAWAQASAGRLVAIAGLLVLYAGCSSRGLGTGGRRDASVDSVGVAMDSVGVAVLPNCKLENGGEVTRLDMCTLVE
jgi:hypothetical protein